MTKLKKIDVGSCAKVFGFIYLAIGALFGIIFTLITALAGGGHMAGFFGFFAVILMPIGYGLAGFIGGAIMAFLYNFASKYVGGITVEIEKGPEQAA